MRKIFIYPFKSEDYSILRHATTYQRVGNKVHFSIPIEDLKNAKESDVMMACGYHPNGYGAPFDITCKDKIKTFYCWGSCD
jgi:hypothetical protein